MDLKLPKSWYEITVDQFIELKSESIADFQSIVQYRMDQLFIITNTDIDNEFWDIPAEELDGIIKSLEWMNSQPTLNFKKNLNEDLFFKDLKTTTIGEFLDLEYWFSINYIEKLPMICAILYRRNRLNEWKHTIIEPRDYDTLERAEVFYDLKITDVYGVIDSFISFKKNFVDKYSNHFEEKEPELKEGEEIVYETIEQKDIEQKEKIIKKWNWERLIYQFAKDYRMQYLDVLDLPLIFFFNQLSMKEDLKAAKINI